MHNRKVVVYLWGNQLKKNNMTKVTVTTIGNQTFLNLFNSREIFCVKGFDTERKARNFAKKWNYTIYEVLPLGIKPFEYCN